MIKNLFKVVLPIFLSVIFGGVSAKVVFSNYDKSITSNLIGRKVYLIQSGAYSNYDNMVNNTLLNNYVYYKDTDGLFKSVVGITECYDNIEKIRRVYTKDVIISEYYSKNNELNTKLGEYDNLLKETTDDKKIKEIILKMLELYKDNDTTLTKIVT